MKFKIWVILQEIEKIRMSGEEQLKGQPKGSEYITGLLQGDIIGCKYAVRSLALPLFDREGVDASQLKEIEGIIEYFEELAIINQYQSELQSEMGNNLLDGYHEGIRRISGMVASLLTELMYNLKDLQKQTDPRKEAKEVIELFKNQMFEKINKEYSEYEVKMIYDNLMIPDFNLLYQGEVITSLSRIASNPYPII